MAFVQEHSNINFHYRTSSVKINDKIFQKILETLLLAHFSNFGGKINFFGKSGSSHKTQMGFEHHAKI